MKSLAARTRLSLVMLALVMGALLFVPAGTVRYWQAWLYLVLFLGASALTSLDLLRRDPTLLERRLRGGPTAETRPVQKFIMLCASICFVAALVIPGLDRRFGWSSVPAWLVLVGDALLLLGFYGVLQVYRVNSFSSATIQVTDDQRVISSGPYAIVRHPMYACAGLYLLGTPLGLASYWAFAAVAVMLPFLIWRLLDEERFLALHLPGYVDYQQRVRYRLLPYVW